MRPGDADAALVAETLRVNDRYLAEVVVAFDLCPWADRALRDGEVLREVVTAPDPAPEAALPFLDRLEADPRAAVGLLVLPRVAADAGGFQRWSGRIREADRARRPPGGPPPPFVLAAFHPFPSADVSTPARAVAFIRRSPDPTIQFVRYAVFESALGPDESLRGRIADRNFETLLAARDRIEAALDDIRRDRDAAYARLAT